MKIIQFSAENVKRLKAVEITPDGTMQVITGKNAAGKSSVLDAIWLALGGGAALKATTKPIRKGEERAKVRLDLGDLVVTRSWTASGTVLKVENAEGAKYGSPQGVLDALVGRLSFDPLEFTRLAPRAQVAALLDLVDLDIDLEAIATERQRAYQERTEIGRDIKILEGNLAALGEQVGEVPETEVSVSELARAFGDANAKYADLAQADRVVTTAQEAHVKTQAQLRAAQADASAAETALLDAKGALAALVVAPLPDLNEIQTQMDNAEATNAAVRRNGERRNVTRALGQARETSDGYTAAISKIDADKAAALSAAKFPVEGLTFDEDGVIYQGVPFSQASAAEQIRVSLGMAMALNPKLRVIRINDGSLLDADGMEQVAKMAAEHDYQVWVERVSDGSGVGVVIEDGQVAS